MLKTKWSVEGGWSWKRQDCSCVWGGVTTPACSDEFTGSTRRQGNHGVSRRSWCEPVSMSLFNCLPVLLTIDCTSRHYQTCFFGSEQFSTVSPDDFFRLSFPKKINKNLPDTLKGIIEGILFTVFVCGSSFSERYKVAVVFLSEELLDFSKSSPWTTCVSGRLCFRLSQSDWACVLHTQMHRQTWSWNALQLD